MGEWKESGDDDSRGEEYSEDVLSACYLLLSVALYYIASGSCANIKSVPFLR